MNLIPELTVDSTIHLYDGRQQSGPMPYADLWAMARSGKLPTHTFFWSPGMPDWLPVGRLPALRSPQYPQAALRPHHRRRCHHVGNDIRIDPPE